MGGNGGENYAEYRGKAHKSKNRHSFFSGDCLVESEAVTERWHLKTVLTKYTPRFFRDPAYDFIIRKKVLSSLRFSY